MQTNQTRPARPEQLGYWRGAVAHLRNLRSIAAGGVLSALGIAIKSLTIPLGATLRISFNFLPMALSGYLFGPLAAGFVGMVVDVLGYLLVPTGPYFFGFTFNVFVSGFIYGCWLYRRPVKAWRTFCAVLCSTAAVSFILNPLWLSLLYGDAFWVLVVARLYKNAIMIPVNSALLFMLLKLAEGQKRRLARG